MTRLSPPLIHGTILRSVLARCRVKAAFEITGSHSYVMALRRKLVVHSRWLRRASHDCVRRQLLYRRFPLTFTNAKTTAILWRGCKFAGKKIHIFRYRWTCGAASCITSLLKFKVVRTIYCKTNVVLTKDSESCSKFRGSIQPVKRWMLAKGE